MNTVKYNTLSANPETEACELKNHIGETIRLHGAVYKIRRMSGFAFVLIRMRDAIVQSVYSEKFLSSQSACRGGMCAAYGTGSCRGTF